jgi:hypothetical protein
MTKRSAKAERFEAWLSGDDLDRVRAAMRAAGARKKSAFVRQCLLQANGAASAADTGAFTLAINDALLVLGDMPQPEEILFQLEQINKLLAQLILSRRPACDRGA